MSASFDDPYPEQEGFSSDDNEGDPRQHLGHPDSMLAGSNCASAEILEALGSFVANCNIHSFGCWGFCIVRTCHSEGDDARVSAAIAKLDLAARLAIASSRAFQNSEDPSSQWNRLWGEEADREALKRYHSILLVHPELNGATLTQARRFFENWAASMEDKPLEFSGSRSLSFILLDDVVLANLESIPSDLSVDAWDSLKAQKKPTGQEWVKLVDVQEGVGSTCCVWLWDLWILFCRLQSSNGLYELPMDWSKDDEWPFYVD